MSDRIDKLTGNLYESEKQMYIRYHGFTESEAESVLEIQNHIERDDIASRIVSRKAYEILRENTIKKHYPEFDLKVISAPFLDPSTDEGQLSIISQILNFYFWNNCPSYDANYNGVQANVHHIQLHCAGEIEIWVEKDTQKVLAVFLNPEPE